MTETPDERPRLLCFPFAGGGAGFFGAWRRLGSPHADVIGVQLPGRESRLREAPVSNVADAVAAVLPAVQAETAKPGRLALFGHSSGAILAFEVARRLDAIDPGRLAHLFVSGTTAPWQPRPGRATGLPDDEFIATVQGIAGFSHGALNEPRLRDLLLPALRADIQMHEDYRTPVGTSVSVPVTALRGQDDALVTADEAAEWSKATRSRFDSSELPGGHMYLTDQREALLALIGANLRDARR
ncbi:thioesterase II family protein [Catellatospora methionotrophica]|uniref:thioesterase II family protein n=1 Tax=Catellatospora methionotrophica TaxID=121620 RepID=UPI0033C88836